MQRMGNHTLYSSMLLIVEKEARVLDPQGIRVCWRLVVRQRAYTQSVEFEGFKQDTELLCRLAPWGSEGGSMEKGGESQGATDAADDVDARTIFVRSLPFSLSDSQLEDVFSEVGPVRHCFTVKEKGSDQHRGFGFVQFAVTEDAHRAVQEKNGALLQGRKIKVEVAKRRAPLNVRLPKSDFPNPEASTPDHEQCLKYDSLKVDSKKRKSNEVHTVPETKTPDGDLFDSKKKLKAGSAVQTSALKEKGHEEQKERNTKKGKNKAGGELKSPKANVKSGNKVEQTKEGVEPIGSSAQRPARTVVVGGLANAEMLEAVQNEAKKAGPIETVQKTLTEIELNSRGLAKDGCKTRAAAIVFLSVKAARQAVAMLHNKTIAGSVVWARQLGGEGSKLKQLRLIVRNLPFQVTEAILRELFSPAGFVWEVTVPRKPDGLSKGFAFIGFTSKADAEKAIKLVNGKLVAKRPIAVDWAVAKKQYEAAVAPATPSSIPDAELDETESTASESESDDNDGGDSESDEDKSEERRQVVVGEQPTSAGRKLKVNNRSHDGLVSENNEEEVSQSKKSGRIVEDGRQAYLEAMGRREEIDMVKKILTKVVASVPDHPSDDDEVVEALESDCPNLKKAESRAVKHLSTEKVAKNVEAFESERHNKNKAASMVVKDLITEKVAENVKTADAAMKIKDTEPEENEVDSDESKLSRTVFIRNLPRDANVPELRKLFSEFGEIKSFRLVLHPATKKSKGNAFLEYAEQEAAQAAVVAATKSGTDDVGLMLKGRPVIVSIAVDKNSARKKAKETFHKQVEEDKRNLALAKEGQILIGTPAAEGVSKRDMAKRQQLEHEKGTKLRSPNFHVSKTRLLVHNIPKAMSDKELKKLFLEGVKSRASRQNPVIKQVKILRDDDSQKSRGAAFVEFTEHQHALVALRVLNNNPATFTTEHRPIVEFAIENSLILRKRAANGVQAKGRGPQRKSTDVVNNIRDHGEESDKMQQRSRQSGKTSLGQDEGEETAVKGNRKRKRAIGRNEARKASKVGQGGEVTPVQHGPQEGLGNGEKQEIKAGRKIKRGKTNGADRKAAQAKRATSIAMDESVKTVGEKKPTPNPKMGNKGNNIRKDNLSERSQSAKQQSLSKSIVRKEMTAKKPALRQLSVSKRENRVTGRQGKNRRKVGETDQLDKLVADYRMKYFSGVTKPSSGKGATMASGDLRRWFE